MSQPNSPAKTPPAAKRPAVNYKLKDNPFFAANRNPEEKDAKPPLAKINKSPVTQTSKLPKPASGDSTTPTAESRKHVRASVQKMAASSTVSANPWKAKMMKPGAIAAKKQQHAGTTTTSTTVSKPPTAATEKQPLSTTTTVKSAVQKAPTPTTVTRGGAQQQQQQQQKQQKDDDSAKKKKNIMPSLPSPSPSKSTSSSTTASTESFQKVNLAKTAAITKEEQKELMTSTTTAPNSPLIEKSNIPAADNKSLSTNASIQKSPKSIGATSSLKDTPAVSTQKLHESNINAKTAAPTITEERSIASTNSTANDSGIDKAKMATSGMVDESISPSPATDRSLVQGRSIKTEPTLATRPDAATDEIKAVQQEPEKQAESYLTTTKYEVEEKEAANQPAAKVALMETALDALRPMSANTDLSISSIQSLSDSDSTSSSSYNEDNGHDDDDDAQEGTTATTLSTNTSSNTLAPSKPTSATATTPIAASSPATAFGIVLPWYQYAHDHAPLIPEQGNGKIMMADPAEIGRQLAVSHAVLTAMDFSTLSSVLDAEKWQRKYTNAKSSVDTIRDRVLLETRIQRTYASMLKLAVDRHSRLLIKDLQARTSNIDQLTQELYYTFSHVCDSQERYLHHLAGTLAVTIQSDERLWRSTSFAATAAEPPSTAATATTTLSSSPASNKKRREEYPDVVLRLEKIAKRCSSSLTTNMSQQYQQDILKRKTKSTTTTRRNTDNMSDDGNLSDDSMFLASVRTSMTSFDDHQQAHALLDIIEKQLSVYGGNGAHVAGDKSTSAGVSTDSNNADLQEELVRLRKREAEMQHRLDTQSSEFSRQRLEWERQLMQATQQQNDQSSSSAIQQKLEQQVAREIEDRKSLEESRRRLEEALRHADHHQAEIQRQLEDSQRDQAQQCQELNQALSQAKHHESRLQEEQTVLQDRIQELEQTLKLATEQQSLEQSSRESAKIYELNQALLQANQRERELVQRVQRLEETTTNLHNEHASRQRNSEQSMLHKFKQERHAIQAELEISRQQETEARSRLDALNAQVKQALTSTSMPSLDAMVDKLIEQQQQRQSSARPASRESSNQQQALDNLRAAFKEAQEEYTRREAALMLQSASVEAELGAIFKEYDKLTRNIADFNYERKKYDQQVQALMREKHLLDKQLADYKVKDGIGKDGQTMTLRKEFRQLMATVKAEHEQAIEKEMEKRRQVESDMRNMKHELEMKRWDTVSTAVQTSFVAYPPPSNATTM